MFYNQLVKVITSAHPRPVSGRVVYADIHGSIVECQHGSFYLQNKHVREGETYDAGSARVVIF